MSTNTYVALYSTTVTGSAAASVTLDVSGITGYTDLVVVVNGSISSTNSDIGWQFNGDTTSSYSQTSMYGTGSGTGSSDRGSTTFVRLGRLSTSNSTSIINFQNYSNTTTYKTSLARGNAADALVIANVGLWRSFFAITSITATVASGANFTVGTTFTAYGIANANTGAYATGGIITQDANYYYHAFGSSSTFTPTRNLTADILVVAGGGGGGRAYGGGGGGGGLLALTSQSLTNGTGYSCTIGAGGAGGTGGAGSTGGNGSNSQFGSLTAAVGGGGGGNDSTAGASGGSSGGGSYLASGGTATSGQGYTGGTGGGNGGGGGGGAGGNGATASGTNAGNGGSGSSAYSSWLSTTGLGVLNTIAGGGGGGCELTTAGTATGGGGAGSSTNAAGSAGLVNTGGGGGGGGRSAGANGNGGAGGSGLIIVRYSK